MKRKCLEWKYQKCSRLLWNIFFSCGTLTNNLWSRLWRIRTSIENIIINGGTIESYENQTGFI